jgi:hypothetical protein
MWTRCIRRRFDARTLRIYSSSKVRQKEIATMFAALAADTGCGLLSRLIADDYQRADLATLTLDRKMGALPQVRRL